MVKLLHLADVHLGAPLYAATDALLKRMRAAQRTAFRRAMSCALQEEVEAVLIAGGLFDDQHLDFSTEQFLMQQLARLDEAGIRCFYAAGPADPGDGRASEAPWPPSLHHFSRSTPETVPLKGNGGQLLAHIVGAGYAGPTPERPRKDRTREDETREDETREGSPPPAAAFPSAPFPSAKGREPSIGLFPDSLLPDADAHPPEAESTGPAQDRHALRGYALRGYAYVALGGAPRRPAGRAADPETARAWYAGPLAGRGPSEAGEQGGLLVTLEAGQGPEVAFRSFAPLCWADVLLDDLDATGTRHALLQQAQRAFDEQAAGGDALAWLARFTLAGACPLAPALREENACARLETMLAEHLDLDAAFVRLHRRLTPPAAPARHRDEPSVLSEALALLDRAAAEPALLRELAPAVLAHAPDDFSGERPGASGLDAYLREHVAALDREACARLLREDTSK